MSSYGSILHIIIWFAFEKNLRSIKTCCTDGVCVPCSGLSGVETQFAAKWRRNWRRQAAIPPFPLAISSEIRAEIKWELKIKKEQWSWISSDTVLVMCLYVCPTFSHRIHIWYIYLHQRLIFIVNLGKYTVPPMDPSWEIRIFPCCRSWLGIETFEPCLSWWHGWQ